MCSARDIKDLREELGTGAADVARIVSEIRERLKVKPRPRKTLKKKDTGYCRQSPASLPTPPASSLCSLSWKTCMMPIRALWIC